MNDRKYTKGDCYAICEFLSWLIQDYRTEIRTIADELGYPQDSMIKLLERLHNDVDSVIGQEQDERDDTDQMADILELKHIPGHDDDWAMRDKHRSHDVKADDTAADLALVICDIYANTSTDWDAMDIILAMCKKILNKGAIR